MTFQSPIPILRIFSLEKAKEFYIDYLGFGIDWQHVFAEGLPVYMQISRAGLTLHLSEHVGDATPGSPVYIPMTGIHTLHAELTAKQYKYFRPGVQRTEWGALVMEVIDPFGSRLRFSENVERVSEPAAPDGPDGPPTAL